MTDSNRPQAAMDRAVIRGRLCGGRPWMGYVLAVVATALATLLSRELHRIFGELPPFITFFPVVALVAMFLGARAGILATVLSAIAVDVFFLPPHGILTSVSLNHAVALGLFVAAGLLMSLMAELLDRARQRQTASQREFLLQALSEGVPDPLFIKNLDSRIVIANSATVRAIGKPAEQIVGHTDAEFYDDPTVAQAMMANDRQVIESGQSQALEEFVPGPKGERTFLSIKAPWHDEQGRIIGVIGCARDITERKAAEQQVNDAMNYVSTLLDASPVGIFTYKASGETVSANQEAARLVGATTENIKKQNWRTLASWKESGLLAMAEKALDTGQEQSAELRSTSSFGHEMWLSCRFVPFTFGGEQHLLFMATDISERGRAEEALRESEARLRAFFEQAAVGTAVADPSTGRFTQVNTKYCQITGYEASELLNMTIWDVTHPLDRDTDQDHYNRLVTGAAKEYLFEKRYLRKDGRVVWVQVAVGMVRDAQGRAVQSVGVIQDITQRKRAEEALRESEAGLAAAQQLAHIGSWQWDVRNDTASWSDETFAVFGMARENLEQHRKSFVNMVHPEDRQRVDQALTDALNGTKEYDLDYRIRRADGSEKVVHSRAEVLRDSDGISVKMRGTIHDITDRRRWEDQLKELNTTLEERVAERTAEAEHRAGQLRALAAQLARAEQKERQRLATILHDHLQQLLASMKFHLSSLGRQLHELRQRESLRQVDSLLNESIDTSRNLTAELSPPILRQGNMRQILEWLGHWFNSKHGLTVEVEVDDQAGPRNHEVRVLLFEAVRELLFNVVKHAKVSQAWVELGRTGGGQVKAVVRDTGVGFDPSQARREGSEGGFGLFSIRERLDWLGGRMEIHSIPSQGTQVTLLVPTQLEAQIASAPTATEVAAPAGTRAPVGDQMTRRKVRILLADDHDVVRNGLAQLLEMEPWIEVVGQAPDGRQAVELALRSRPDVVIVDVSMPVLDGIEATRQILAQQPQVKVIGLSMFDEAGVIQAMKAAGATTYLAKTSGPDALIAAIRQCAAKPLD